MTREVAFTVDNDDRSIAPTNIWFRKTGGGTLIEASEILEDAGFLLNMTIYDDNLIVLRTEDYAGNPVNLHESVASDPEMIRLTITPHGEASRVLSIPGPRFPQLEEDPLNFFAVGDPLADYEYTVGASSVKIFALSSISASDPIADFIQLANDATNPGFHIRISNSINEPPEIENEKYLRLDSSGNVEEAPARHFQGTATTRPSYKGDIVSLSEGGRFSEEVMPLGVKSVTVKAISESHLAGDFVNLSHHDDGYLQSHYLDDRTEEDVQGFVLEDSVEFTETTVYLSGINDQLSGLTPGMPVYLDRDGLATHTAPTASGRFVHYVGNAISSTAVWFNPAPAIELE